VTHFPVKYNINDHLVFVLASTVSVMVCSAIDSPARCSIRPVISHLHAEKIFFYFNFQVHLQSVQEHSAKGVRRGTWKGAPSSAPPQVLGVKPHVLDGKLKR
jgi:hypothetical protein